MGSSIHVSDFPFPARVTRYARFMVKGEGIHRDIGRQTPAPEAHIFLGQPNIFFVTVNAKDAVPWMAEATVQKSLTDIWRAKPPPGWSAITS